MKEYKIGKIQVSKESKQAKRWLYFLIGFFIIYIYKQFK